MNQILTDWQRAYQVRSTLDKQLNNLSETLVTKDTDEILSAFNRFEETLKQLKELYARKMPHVLDCGS